MNIFVMIWVELGLLNLLVLIIVARSSGWATGNVESWDFGDWSIMLVISANLLFGYIVIFFCMAWPHVINPAWRFLVKERPGRKA